MERRDLELVLATRDQQSLVGAAAAMGVAPSVVTRCLIDFLVERFRDEPWTISATISRPALRGSRPAR